MSESYIFNLPKEFQGERLDQSITRFAQSNYDQNITREKIREAITSGNLTLDKKQFTKAGYKVKGSELVELTLDSNKSDLVPDKNVEFEVVFEDDSILVINKPAGLVVHPGAGVKDSTLVHGILGRFSVEDDEEHERPGIVHRLDRGTSGLMVVAKTTQAKLQLQSQFKPPRTIHRDYVCIVKGLIQVRKGVQFQDRKGKISVPLARSERNRTTFDANFEGGKEAVTTFEIIKSSGTYHLAYCTLETGRTHQIRAHMKYIGLPILGDTTYGGEKKGDWPLLHARRLSFIHPLSRKKVSFDATPPPDFKEVEAELFD